MKIGITCYPTYGGSGVVATELGIELAARGHEIHFISYAQPFRLSGREERIHFHEVSVSNYPLFEFPPYSLALATRMSEVAVYYDLDLLHVHYAIPHSVSALLARQMLARQGRRLPFVTTLHGTDITLVGADRAYLPITSYAIDESDGVTSISDYLRGETIATFGTKRHIEVISNFVNCDLYVRDPIATQKIREQYAQPDEAVLVHLSNFRPVKRIHDVIEIFARVAGEMPARLLMIGDGPERSSAEWLAKSLKISNRVSFLGKHEHVNELLPAADLMLLPSELESFGLAALEAMACEVPTVGNTGRRRAGADSERRHRTTISCRRCRCDGARRHRFAARPRASRRNGRRRRAARRSGPIAPPRSSRNTKNFTNRYCALPAIESLQFARS